MTDLLAIYLNDHLAASTGGVGLARRSLAAHAEHDPDTARLLREVTAEIEADKHELEAIMRRVGARQDPVKRLVAGAAERVGRLKGNGRLVRRSPLSSLVELEGLTIAVQGKRCGWRALQQLDDPRLVDVDLARLVERAEEQYRRLEERRLAVAARVLAGRGAR